MLGSLLGGLIDKEKAIENTITNVLYDCSEELGVGHKDFFVIIRPVDENCNFKFHLYRQDGGKPIFVREITVKEVVG
jgi:hypothetical protein